MGRVRRYRDLLGVPRLAPLMAVMALARLPIGVNGLAIILLVKAETDSFATAGAVAGGLALGMGAGAPLQGRLVDRVSRRVLAPLAAGHAAGLLMLLGLSVRGAPAPALVATAVLCGIVLPPVSSVLRSHYAPLLGGRRDLLPAAFALDSVLTELIFVAGPLLTALLVALASPGAALVLSASAVLAGTLGFLAVLGPAEAVAPGRAGGAAALGALGSPSIRTLVLSMLPVGVAFGALEVALPAFTEEHGRPELAGVIIAIWAVASAVGGFAYGARAWEAPLASVHLRLAILLPLGFVPLVVAPNVAVMALLVVPAGLLIAPLLATRNELAGAAAPPGAETEAYTWPITALVGGVAVGAAAAGALVEGAGWQAAVLLAVLSAAMGATVAATRRTTLAAGASAPET